MSTLAILKSSFAELLDLELEAVSVKHVEAWRTGLTRRGLKVASINRKVTALKAALNWAYKRGIIDAYPLARLGVMLRDESDYRVRYLSERNGRGSSRPSMRGSGVCGRSGPDTTNG